MNKTLLNLCILYHCIKHEDSVAIGESHPCGKCLLCNRGGESGMVKKTNLLKSKSGKIIKLKKNLNCKSFGIYVAKCNVCDEHYVGQTITSFY